MIPVHCITLEDPRLGQRIKDVLLVCGDVGQGDEG